MSANQVGGASHIGARPLACRRRHQVVHVRARTRAIFLSCRFGVRVLYVSFVHGLKSGETWRPARTLIDFRVHT